MTGQAFGKYELLKMVGTGGMAELFLARQSGIEGFEKLIVIKRILPHLSDSRHSSQFVQMFLDEARLAAQLTHPNIIQIYDLGRVDDQYFIAMEYVNGVDLSQIFKRESERGGYVPVEHVVKIATYICEALSYAHNRTDEKGNPLRVVHRDVSPHNVLIAFDGGIKLTDFGIAKASSQMGKTRVGTIKGKYSYMSPEQVAGLKVDHRSDLFTVGVLIYQLTTRRLPFSGRTEKNFMRSIIRDPITPPSRFRPDYPPGLEAVLTRALSKDPDDRFPDALALQVALEGFLMEQKAVSNSTLISQYVCNLFSDLVQIQAKASPDGRTATVEGILDALEASRIVKDEPLSQPAAGTAAAVTSAERPSDDLVSFAEDVEEPTEPTRRVAKEEGTYLVVSPSQVISRPLVRLGRFARSLGAGARRSILMAVLAACALILVAVFAFQSADRAEAGGESGPGEVLGSLISMVAEAWENAAPSPGEEEPAPEDEDLAEPRKPKRPSQKRTRKSRGQPVRQPPPRAESKTGTLTVNTNPWSEVWVDGKKLGLTPLAYKELPAGRHKLVLYNPRLQLRKTLFIHIQPSETTELDIDLRK